MQERLTERDDGEYEWQAAGREHTAPGGLDQVGHIAVAVVETARRVGDADDRARQQVVAIAHRAGERAPEIKGEVGITVMGEPAGKARLGC